MAADRITKETADLIAIPPLTIEVQKVKFMLLDKRYLISIGGLLVEKKY